MDDLTADKARKLLNTLNDLVDFEIILLIYHAANSTTLAASQFWQQNRDRLESVLYVGNDTGSPHMRDIRGFRDAHLESLKRLGLLEQTGMARPLPTEYGGLLLRFIGADQIGV